MVERLANSLWKSVINGQSYGRLASLRNARTFIAANQNFNRSYLTASQAFKTNRNVIHMNGINNQVTIHCKFVNYQQRKLYLSDLQENLVITNMAVIYYCYFFFLTNY